MAGTRLGVAAGAGMGVLGLGVLGRMAAHSGGNASTLGLDDCINIIQPVPSTAPNGKRIAAIFDVDGTLYSVPGDPTGAATAVIHMLRAARAHSQVRNALLVAGIVPLLLLFLVIDKTDRIFSMWLLSTLAYCGIGVDTLAACMEDFMESAQWKQMQVESVVARLKWHLAQGHLVILLSASPLQVTVPIARYLGAHIACGSRLVQSSDGIEATHTTTTAKKHHEQRPWFVRAQFANCSLVGPTKMKLLAHLVDLHKIDLSKSYGYGDHITDVALLEKVGRPIAANPTQALFRIAQAQDWEVLSREQNPDKYNRTTISGLLQAVSYLIKSALEGSGPPATRARL